MHSTCRACRRGSAETEALYGAGREAGQPDRPAFARRHPAHLDPQRGRGGRIEPEADRLGRACRLPAHADRHGEHGQCALPCPRARHRDPRDQDRARRRLSHAGARLGEDLPGRALGRRHDLRQCPRRAWSSCSASRSRPISTATCSTSPIPTRPASSARSARTLGEAGINIGTFHLGRREAGGEAILLLSVDEDVPQALIRKIEAVPSVRRVIPLKF